MAHTQRRPGLLTVLAVLFATAWAVNSLAALIPALRDRDGISHTMLSGFYGL